jgi:sulfide dehydrogenase cytochrome subunit
MAVQSAAISWVNLIQINIDRLYYVVQLKLKIDNRHAEEKNMKSNIRILALLCMGVLLYDPLISNVMAADIATLTAPCEDCHGKDGASHEPKIPTIAGSSTTYIIYAMEAFRDKTWPCEDIKYPAGTHKGETSNMCKAAENLSEEDIKLVSDHYAGKPFVRAKQTFDADLAKRGKGIHELNCRKCHEDGGSSPDDDAGILAGQWMPYLEEQLEEFVSGKRPMPEKKQPKMEKLTEDDIKALVNYYGSFQ